ncbi:MAG TPA: acyl CoA:acetate/3-ketoacid CoA transferase, partial [Telluria sp.]
AQADSHGNLNVSKFGSRLAGAGGFINISQNAKEVVFVGTFNAGLTKLRVEDGRLHIEQEGNARKFVREVEHRTFSGAYAARRGQPVLYITERCVFRLCAEGLELTEIAPGIDLDRDILAQMDFAPIIRQAPRLMDARIFQPEPMGLRRDLLAIPLKQRLLYDAQQNLFFVNLEGVRVSSRDTIEQIRTLVAQLLDPLGKKVYAVVNYDNFSIEPDLVDEYSEMVKYLVDRYYLGATRYTTSMFLRVKLGNALEGRAVAPHIYESAEEARNYLRDLEAKAGK